MKKYFIAVMAAAAMIGFTACGSDKENKSSSADNEEEMVMTEESVSEDDNTIGTSSSEASSSSSSSDDYSSSSSSSSSDYVEDARNAAHDATDKAEAMIEEELDKHGVAGKAAKHLYKKSASDVHDAIDEAADAMDDF